MKEKEKDNDKKQKEEEEEERVCHRQTWRGFVLQSFGLRWLSQYVICSRLRRFHDDSLRRLVEGAVQPLYKDCLKSA